MAAILRRNCPTGVDLCASKPYSVCGRAASGFELCEISGLIVVSHQTLCLELKVRLDNSSSINDEHLCLGYYYMTHFFGDLRAVYQHWARCLFTDVDLKIDFQAHSKYPLHQGVQEQDDECYFYDLDYFETECYWLNDLSHGDVYDVSKERIHCPLKRKVCWHLGLCLHDFFLSLSPDELSSLFKLRAFYFKFVVGYGAQQNFVLNLDL
jgi:hypothetical protein